MELHNNQLWNVFNTEILSWRTSSPGWFRTMVCWYCEETHVRLWNHLEQPYNPCRGSVAMELVLKAPGQKTSPATMCLLPEPEWILEYHFFQLERPAAVGLSPYFTLYVSKAILPRSQCKLIVSSFWSPASVPTAQNGLQALSNRASATTKPICTAAPLRASFRPWGENGPTRTTTGH